MDNDQKNIGMSKGTKIKRILIYVSVGLFFVFISLINYNMLYSKTMDSITKTAELNAAQSSEQIMPRLRSV